MIALKVFLKLVIKLAPLAWSLLSALGGMKQNKPSPLDKRQNSTRSGTLLERLNKRKWSAKSKGKDFDNARQRRRFDRHSKDTDPMDHALNERDAGKLHNADAFRRD